MEAEVQRLLSSGYAVVPSVMSQEDLSHLRTMGEVVTQKKKSMYPLGKMPTVEWMSSVDPAVQRKLDGIRIAINRAGCPADTAGISCVFIAVAEGQLEYHSDFGLHFSSQGTENCVRAWIPVVKPNPDGGGLDIVRTDDFLEANPQMTQYVRNRGAITIRNNEKLARVCSEQGAPIDIPLNGRFSDFVDTPRIAEGDVLLFKGDVIHRSSQITNESDNSRVALAFHWHWGDKVLKRQNLYGPEKSRQELGRDRMSTMLLASWLKGGDFTFRDFRETFDRVAQKKPLTLLQFGCAYALEPFYRKRAAKGNC
jgi:hypothetical protein